MSVRGGRKRVSDGLEMEGGTEVGEECTRYFAENIRDWTT